MDVGYYADRINRVLIITEPKFLLQAYAHD